MTQLKIDFQTSTKDAVLERIRKRIDLEIQSDRMNNTVHISQISIRNLLK